MTVKGTFWAETYPGSGRLTGHTTTANKTHDSRWVLYSSRQRFESDFLWQQHDACHSGQPDDNCQHCKDAGWLNDDAWADAPESAAWLSNYDSGE